MRYISSRLDKSVNKLVEQFVDTTVDEFKSLFPEGTTFIVTPCSLVDENKLIAMQGEEYMGARFQDGNAKVRRHVN